MFGGRPDGIGGIATPPQPGEITAATDSATAVPVFLAAAGQLRNPEAWQAACPGWDAVIQTIRHRYPHPPPLLGEVRALIGAGATTARLRTGAVRIAETLAGRGEARTWTLPALIGAVTRPDGYIGSDEQEVLLRALAGGLLGDLPKAWADAVRAGQQMTTVDATPVLLAAGAPRPQPIPQAAWGGLAAGGRAGGDRPSRPRRRHERALLSTSATRPEREGVPREGPSCAEADGWTTQQSARAMADEAVEAALRSGAARGVLRVEHSRPAPTAEQAEQETGAEASRRAGDSRRYRSRSRSRRRRAAPTADRDRGSPRGPGPPRTRS